MSRITSLRHYSGMTPMTMGWVGSKYPRYIVGWLGPAFDSSGLAVKSRPICPSVFHPQIYSENYVYDMYMSTFKRINC